MVFKTGMVLAVGSALGAMMSPVANADAAEVIWRQLSQFALDSNVGPAFVDLDGDGINEIVITGKTSDTPAGGVIGVLKEVDGEFELVDVQASYLSSGRYVIIPADAENNARLLVASSNGQTTRVTELADVPLRPVQELSFDFPIMLWAFGDIDGDGSPELLDYNTTQTPTAVRAIDYVTGQVKWTYPMATASATSLSAVQLDDDAELEVVLGGSSPGLVLNGADGSVEWSYAPGFGAQVHVGRFHDTVAHTFATRGTNVVVFRSQPYTPLFDFSTSAMPWDYGASVIRDVNGDGIDDLFIAPYFTNSAFRAYDMRSGQLISTWPSYFPNSSAPGFGRLQPGSPLLLAHGSNAGFGSGPFGVEVKSFPDGAVLFRNEERTGPFDRVAAADVDGDGNVDMVSLFGRRTTTPSFSSFDLIVSSEAGTLKATRHFSDLSWEGVLLATADLDGKGGDEIVIAARRGAVPIIVALDGSTLETLWERQAASGSDLQGLSHVSLSSADFTGDGLADVVLLMNDFEFGNRVVALSGLDGATLWRSLAMPGIVDHRSMLIAEIDGDGGAEVIVTGGHVLHIFDSLTRALQWVWPLDNWSATSAVVVGEWPNCRLGLVESGTMRLFDCFTRQLTGTVPLPDYDRYVRPVNEAGSVFLTEPGMHILKQIPAGFFSAPSSARGHRMSVVPDRMLVPNGMGDSIIDLMVGTPAFPARIRMDLSDPLFRNGFD